MKFFCTEIWAIPALNPTGKVMKFGGPNVPGINEETAQQYCEDNGLGYCKVVGELVAEVPCKEGTYEPDFPNMSDYETIRNN